MKIVYRLIYPAALRPEPQLYQHNKNYYHHTQYNYLHFVHLLPKPTFQAGGTAAPPDFKL
jgi:hypothetical protein